MLAPAEEAQFQAWVQANKNAPGVKNWDAPDAHYDMRGFFHDKPALAAWTPGAHFPDTYKQHGHETFSVESKYSKGPGDGGTWKGNTFVPAGTSAPATTTKAPPAKGAARTFPMEVRSATGKQYRVDSQQQLDALRERFGITFK
jgi:hypothetical protein